MTKTILMDLSVVRGRAREARRCRLARKFERMLRLLYFYFTLWFVVGHHFFWVGWLVGGWLTRIPAIPAAGAKLKLPVIAQPCKQKYNKSMLFVAAQSFRRQQTVTRLPDQR